MKPAIGLTVALVLAACSGVSSTPEDDLVAVTRVLAVPIEHLDVVGKDAEAFVADAPGDDEERLDRFSVAIDNVEFVDVFSNTTPPDDPIVFVRDPLSKGSIDVFVPGLSDVVVVMRPLLDPTRRGAEFDVWLIGLDGDGRMIRADWEGSGLDRMADLMDWAVTTGTSPADAVAWAARGLAGVSDDPLAREAAAILEG